MHTYENANQSEVDWIPVLEFKVLSKLRFEPLNVRYRRGLAGGLVIPVANATYDWVPTPLID